MIYDLNVRPDWWKLPTQSEAAWQSITDLVEQRAPHCRGVILLGLDAPIDTLKAAFKQTANYPICKGFAVGRSIFSTPSQQWLKNDISDAEFKQQVADNYLQLANAWLNRKAS
jgi:5-dehydro-2-deoxygluconokinase